MTFQPIELGDRVKDPLSGLAGITIAITIWLHGSVRVSLQQEGTREGKPHEATGFDQSQLTVIDKRVITPMVMQGTGPKINLGDRVKDPITKLTGIVTAHTVWLHGCDRVMVQPEKLEGGRPADEIGYDANALELVKRAVHKPKATIVNEYPEPVTRRSNGGPKREGRAFHRRDAR